MSDGENRQGAHYFPAPPLHKKSSFFVKDGLFNKVNSFKDLESYKSDDTKAKLDSCRGSGSEISYSYHLDLGLYNKLKSSPKGKVVKYPGLMKK